MAIDSSGNLYIGGSFSSVAGVPAENLAMWDGTAWSEIGGGVRGQTFDVLALECHGTDVFVAGGISSAGGQGVAKIARWDGANWHELSTGLSGTVRALHHDGTNLYAGGNFSRAGFMSAANIARWDGTSWSPLGAGTNLDVFNITTNGGDLYATGVFTEAGGQAANYVAKWNGTSWSALGDGLAGSDPHLGGYSLVASGPNLYVSGLFEQAGGLPVPSRLAMWDGNHWEAVTAPVGFSVNQIRKIGGQLLAIGTMNLGTPDATRGVFMLDGSQWTQVGELTNLIGSKIAGTDQLLFTASAIDGLVSKFDGEDWKPIEAGLGGWHGYSVRTEVNALINFDGSLIAGGFFRVAGEKEVANIARWDGAAWNPLGPGLNGTVHALTQIGNDLYAGGEFTMAGSTEVDHVAKWDGTQWHPLGSGTNDSVYALTEFENSLVIGGDFTVAGGVACSHIAQWDGGAWNNLGPGTNGRVRALAAQTAVPAPPANLFVGGEFTEAGGVPMSRLARWNGTEWHDVGSGIGGSGAKRVNALLLSNGFLYVGGNFESVGTGVDFLRTADIARWSSSGWESLGTGLESRSSEEVFAIVESGTDIYAGGSFLEQGATVEPSQIAKWDGNSWQPLGSGTFGSGIGSWDPSGVFALAMRDSYTLFAGGDFESAGGKPIPWIAQANLPDTFPELTLESKEGNPIAHRGTFNFGNVTVSPGSTTTTLTIRNPGTSTLTISGVTLGGADAADFSLDTSALVTTIPPTGSTMFDLTLSPAALGLRTALLSINSNDPDIDPFEITVTGTGAYPDILIESPTGTQLSDGDTVDFGPVVPSYSTTRRFTITNQGDSDLTLTGISFLLADIEIFAPTFDSTIWVIPAGQSTFFDVQFQPENFGPRSAPMRFHSDDPDEGLVEITLTGTGAHSEISVEAQGTGQLADGDPLDLGSAIVGTGEISRLMTVRNDGPAPLALGTPVIDGPASAEFSVDTTGMDFLLASGASTSFTITHQPSAPGGRSALLHIPNNDADENPFDLALSGTGITPEITVSRVGGGNLEDGVGSVDFGNVIPTGMQTLVFRLTNDGTAPLNLNPSIARTGSNWFVANTDGMATSLAPGEDTTFSITFSPPDSALSGPRNASFRLLNDDLNENDFDIAVSGVVIKPEIEVAGPDSNLIVDAGGFDLGRVQTGETGLARTFTITNAGTYRLNLSGVTVGGTHSAEFVAGTSSMATVLDPTESTTFTVTFSPTVKGTRTASLQIGNDDFQQSPFDITLTGFGNEPEIEVEDPQGTVLVDDVGQVDLDPVGVGSQGDWKTFRIRNTGATTLNVGEIRFTGTHAGQFSRNLAGFDTTITPNGSSTFTVRFSPTSEGLRQAVLEIESDDFDEPTFRVHLAGTGQNNQAPEITLLGDDPLVFEAAESYSDPGATATDDEDGSLTPTISANNVDPDRVGTYSVTWSVTDSLNASDSATRSVQVVDTTPPEIVPPDDIEIEATDADGAEVIYPNATVSDIVAVRSVTYSPSSGSRFPVGETVVTVTATDLAGNVSNAEFLVTVLPGSLDRQGPRVRILSPNARTRTVPATFDISGDAFDNFGIDSLVVTVNGESLPLDGEPPVARNERELWSVSGVEAENGPNRIEVVATDFAGRIGRAVRTVNYFQERPELAGYYAGVLAPSQEPSLDTTGLIVIQVRDNGLFTGRVFLGGFVRPIRGVLGNEGNARFFPQLGNSFEIRVGGGANARSLGFVSFSVDDLLGFSGSLMESDEELASELASFAGRKAPHTFRNQVSEELLNQPVNRTPTRGYHTISFPNKDQDPARDPSSFPQGDGAGILILSRTGSARLTGFLADGTRFVSSGRLREDETLPVFARIHARKGNLSGELSFEDLPDSDVSGLGFLWLRPELPRSPRYPDGWPGGIRVDALGTLFAFPGSVDFTQGAADPENGNAAFQFSDGGLGDLVAHVVSIDPDTGRLIRVPVPNRNIFPRLNWQSGWLTGRFRLENGRLAPFRGVLLNKGANRGGFGYFITPGRDSEGGGMSLIPQSALE